MSTSLRALSGAPVLFLVACGTWSTPGETGTTPESPSDADRLVPTGIATVDVTIDDYLEIDDVDTTENGSADANLCSAGTVSPPTCPVAGTAQDNPSFPGPDPANPGALGAADAYIDWEDLDPAGPHFLTDLGAGSGRDDVFKGGACVGLGVSPGKADLQQVGIAGNDTWLYLMSRRSTVQGQEEHHYFFTQKTPEFAVTSACAGGTWLFDMSPGDTEVTVRFQSTAGLPDGAVFVREWGGTANDLRADEMIQSSQWLTPNASLYPPPLQPAYVAFNVAPGVKSPDADRELGLDGNPLQSGEIAELAVDVARVFGSGCGLNRTMTVVTTASGSGGDRDDLKDILAPVTFVSSAMTASVTITPACGRAFDYAITAYKGGVIALPDPDLDVSLTYDCGGGSSSVSDDDGTGTVEPGGTGTSTCEVTASVTGTGGRFASCTATDTATATLHAGVTPSGALSQSACGDTWAWTGAATGGAEPYAYAWTFTGASPGSSTEASGTGALPSGSAPVDIAGDLVVTDTRGCTGSIHRTTQAYHALSLAVTPTTPSSECYTGDVAFSADIAGGSGHYSMSWGVHDDARLDAACAATTSATESDGSLALACGFGLGTAACAQGSVDLTVRDDVCGSAGPLGVRGSRVSTTTVGHTP